MKIADTLGDRLVQARKTLQALYAEHAWFEQFLTEDDPHYDSLFDATQRLIIQARQHLRDLEVELFRGLDRHDQDERAALETINTPILPLPVIEDDRDQPATHLLDCELERCTTGCIIQGYASLGRKPHSRRYEGFYRARIR
jgi:hypothetical protein